MKKTILLSALFLFLFANHPLSAARLDKNGCYTNKKTGEYVCPHGNKSEAANAKRETDSAKATAPTKAEKKTPKVSSRDQNCCRICKTGKPCGDGCIAKNETCHKDAGCACEYRAE